MNPKFIAIKKTWISQCEAKNIIFTLLRTLRGMPAGSIMVKGR